jgi:hypothetical protein
MIWVLNIDVAISAMRRAFSPLSCGVEVYDYQKLIRLWVPLPDKTAVLSIFCLSLRDVVDPSVLRAELEQARARIEAKGFRLRSWTLPDWQTHTGQHLGAVATLAARRTQLSSDLAAAGALHGSDSCAAEVSPGWRSWDQPSAQSAGQSRSRSYPTSV